MLKSQVQIIMICMVNWLKGFDFLLSISVLHKTSQLKLALYYFLILLESILNILSVKLSIVY
jgi:hypothetical protein